MVVSSKSSTRCKVKSISLPSRSHPTTLRIEQALRTTATTVSGDGATAPSAETVCDSLSQVEEVYKCMDDLLNSTTTQVLISRQQNKKWVEDLIEESVRFLDVCSSIRDIIAQIKEHVIDLHRALRRRKGYHSNIEKSISKYNCFRKKMRKDVKLLVGSLSQVDHMTSSMALDSDSHEISAVIKAMVGGSETTVSVLESLLLFFSMPVSKVNKWSIVVSKLIHKGMVGCEEQKEKGSFGNEFESMGAILQSLCKYESSIQGETIEIAKCRLEKLENRLECMETRLECVFRRMIGIRVSLLNTISHVNR